MIQYGSGEPGFDRMLLQQANIEASTTVGDQIRLAIDARPTYVQSGTADGQSTLRFGTAPVGAIAGLQTASGLAADAQISSQMFGLHAGMTPQGFLVKNLTGGFRFTPGNGHITFMLNRDSIADTLISFAGEKDPVTERKQLARLLE